MIKFKAYFYSFLFTSLCTTHPQAIDFHDAIKGCLFGGAMGDAMGRPTEFIKSVDKMYERYPDGIRSFKDFKSQDFSKAKNGAKIAAYTDDTAMSLLTMKTLLKARENDWDLNTTMCAMAREYVQDMQQPDGWAAPYRAPGLTCLANVKKLAALIAQNKLHDEAWAVGTQDQGGCGSVMHAHPFGIIFANDPDKAASWAAEHSKLTHSAPMAQAACAAMAVGTAYALQKKDYEFIYYAMIEEAGKYDQQTADSMGKALGYAIINRHNIAALNRQEQWPALVKISEPVYKEFLGWDARSAIAATLYTFAVTYASSVQKAIYLGVHTPGDSDSIASMAGALVGAKSGFNQLKKGWEHDLELLEGNRELAQLAQEAGR